MITEKLGTEKIKDRCPECGYDVIVNSPETGENVCARCGLVIREASFDRGPEWRAYTFEERADRSRVGSPVTILQADKGLPTVIQGVNKDASGRPVSPKTYVHMQRLKKWQSRVQFRLSAERNLIKALSELDRIVDQLHIGHDLQEEAAEIYRRALDKSLVQGRSISAIIAACVYAACRRAGRPRSLNEIASVSRVKLKNVARCYRMLLQEIPIQMPVPDPSNYISKIAAKAGISEPAQVKARALLKQAEKVGGVTGKDPIGLAAAALYVVCLMLGERKTQREIAEAAAVTEVTLRNRTKSLQDIRQLNLQ